MKREYISISCPFCHGNKSVKVDITEVLDKKIQDALIKVYSSLKQNEELDKNEH